MNNVPPSTWRFRARFASPNPRDHSCPSRMIAAETPGSRPARHAIEDDDFRPLGGARRSAGAPTARDRIGRSARLAAATAPPANTSAASGLGRGPADPKLPCTRHHDGGVRDKPVREVKEVGWIACYRVCYAGAHPHRRRAHQRAQSAYRGAGPKCEHPGGCARAPRSGASVGSDLVRRRGHLLRGTSLGP